MHTNKIKYNLYSIPYAVKMGAEVKMIDGHIEVKRNNSTIKFDMKLKSAYSQKSQKDLVHFLHACAGFPTAPTWLEARKNNHFATWPGLNPRLIGKYLGKSEATTMGHMTVVRRGIRSIN